MRSNYFLKQLGVLLILSFSIFGTKNGYGQTYLSESFEGTWSGTPTVPSGWSNIHTAPTGGSSGTSPLYWAKNSWSGSAWSSTSNGTPTTPTGAQSGTSVAWYNDYNAKATQKDQLTTGDINLAGATNPRVTFYLAINASSSVTIKLRGSNNGGSSWADIQTISKPGVAWTKVSVNVSSYMVSNARFGIEVTTTWGSYDVWLDNFVVEETPTPLTGTKTIKASGGDYSTFTDAINALNDAGVGSGGVTFDVDAGFTSTEYLPIITATGTSSDPIVFQKSGSGANPVITAGTGTSTTIDALVRIAGGDYITFDGIDVQENASNATSTTRMEFGYYIYNASATNGAQNNTIKNCKITLNRANTTAKGIYQYTASTATNATGANSNNKYQSITVENSYSGIYCSGTSATYPDLNTEISSCIIGSSSANDIGNGSSASYGIYMYYQSASSIFSNEIRNITVTSTVAAYGMYLSYMYGTSNVYNNKIHDIKTTSTSTSSLLYGLNINTAASAVCNIYNNVLYSFDHAISSANSTQVIRMIASNQASSSFTGTNNFYYNSARLDENAAPSSTIFYMYYGTANLKNNIFANFSTAGGTSVRYCIYKNGGTIGTSNYNDFYINNGSTNCNVGYSTSNQNTLSNWQTASGKDANSKNVDPSFASTTDLHSTSTDLNAAGSPVTTAGGDAINLSVDFEGDSRDGTTPDIGADEFTVSTKTLGTIVYNQASTNNVNIGSNNNQILRIDMPVTGSTGTLILNSLTVSSLNLSDADIATSGVKLYRTSSTTFSTANQLGTSQSFSGGSATFSSLNYDLPGVSTTYLWVTYDIVGGATVGNTVDAQIPTNGINVASITYPGSAQSPAGNRTIANDKVLSSITVSQASTSTAIKGTSNNETLLLDFYVTGSTSTLPLNSIAVTYTGTSASDINTSGVKLYRTATSSFATDNLLGTAQSLSGGIATFSSLAYDLPAGHTYIWVTFDVASAATNNNKVDAKIAANGINVNGGTYNSVENDPAGNRNIFYDTYTLPFSEIFSGSTSSLPTNWSYLTSSFTQSTGSTYHGKDDTHGIYKNLWSSGTTANAITPIIGPIEATSQLEFDYRILEYTGYPASATANATFGTGTLKVQVSTDGSSYSDIYTINNSNHVESTGFATKSVSLAAYNGQNIYVKFLATWGTAGDYYVDIDNVKIVEAPTPLSGTYTIKASGGDYATFTAAVNDLNYKGISSAVIFNVDANYTSTENVPAITTTGTITNTIKFQKSGVGNNPIITAGTGVGSSDAVIKINGGDYITFDGIDIQENGSNATSTTQAEYGYYIYNSSASNGAQHVTIKNSNITLNRSNTNSKAIYQNTGFTASATTGANSYNVFQNIIVQNSYQGIYINGTSAYPDLNIEVTGSTIGSSSSNDIGNGSLTTSGIYIANASDIIIQSNEVRNVTTTGAVNVYGINLTQIGGTSNVNNNTIHNISTTYNGNTSLVYGLKSDVAASSTMNIYTNILYGFSHGLTTASGTVIMKVISLNTSGSYTGTINLYYNSARLDEDEFPSSSIVSFVAGTVLMKNNNFANFSTPGSTSYRYVIEKIGGTIAASTDYNNYYIDNSQTNSHVAYSGSNLNALSDWTTATSVDANSYNANPGFTSSTNLHSSSSSLNNSGVEISTGNGDALDITEDYDANPRSSTNPDIGAFEYDLWDLDSKVLEPAIQVSSGSISSTANTSGSAVEVFKFSISDLGTSDGNRTKVTNIRITNANPSNGASWTANIQGVRLYDGLSVITTGTPNITSSYIDIPISTGDLEINDGVEKEISLRVFLNNSGIEDGKKLQFTIPATSHGFSADPIGSIFDADFQNPITSDEFTIAVVATKLVFSGEPSQVLINSEFGLTVRATDANGNIDLNNSSSVTISKASGNGIISSTSGLTMALTSGVGTWSDLVYSKVENFTLSASASGLTSATSASIACINEIIVGSSTSSNQSYPFDVYFGYSRNAGLYLNSEIGSYLTLNKLAWQVASAQSTSCPIKIYLKKTSATTITADTWANMISGATLVYNGTVQFNQTGWFDIAFTSSFNYDSDNLLVLTEGNYTGGGNGTYPLFYYTSATNMNASIHQDDSEPTGSLAVGNNRPNIRINIPFDMEYTSSTTSQPLVTAVDAGTTSQQVLRIQVSTLGSLNPLQATKFTVNANGTTSATDISNARIYYTGASSTFTTSTLFGTNATPTIANFDITGTQQLAEGTNYFWLAYDVNSTATNSNVIDGEVISITIDGNSEIPTATAPAGTRTITNKTITSITVTQASTTEIVAGTTNNQILRLDFLVAGPSTGSLLLNSIDIQSLNTNDADVSASGVKLYNTLTSSTFASSSQIGTSGSFSGGGVTFGSINYNLPGANAHTYIWLSYDVSASGTDGNTLDAKIPANGISVGSSTYNVAEESPAGTRILKSALMGTKNVGTSGDYPTLTGTGGLFEAINSLGLKGNLTVNIISDITEPGTVVLNQWNEVGGSNYTLTIRPDQGSSTLRTLSGSYAGRLISLNGADRVTFDGRISGSGTYLAISNTSTSGSAIGFINDATGNTVRNCDLTGVGTSAANAVVVFSTSTGTTGNDDNTITYNKIHSGASVSTSAIYSYGTSAKENSNITISNNEIYDFWLANGTSYGINANYYSTGWTISNNSFYQSTSRTSTGAATIYPIYVYDGTGYTISGNYIGGSSASCGGSAWTVNGSYGNVFSGIYFIAGAIKTASIQSNTIKNFNFTSTSTAATGVGVWSAIYSSSGDLSIGNSSANTIGDNSATSITISAGNGALVNGISVASTGTCNISNNAIGGFELTGAAAIGYTFKGITTSGSAGIFTIGSNTIGSSATSNNIKVGVLSTTTASTSFVGIDNSATGTISITNNTIANSNAYGTGSTGQLAGIKNSGGIATITTNTIRNLNTYSSNLGTGASSSLIGISETSTTAGNHTVGQNVVHSMKSYDAAAAVKAIGIYYSGPSSGTNAISRNFVHSFDMETSSSTAVLTGIEIGGGVATTSNNMIRLGIDASGSSLNNDLNINGILKSTTANNDIYFNSIYIGGSAVVSTSATSFGFRRTATGTDNFKNNIVVNNRNNASGSGKHYTIGIDATTTFTSNNNVFNATGSGAKYGLVNTTDCSSFSDWKTNNGSNDGSSADADPFFENPDGDVVAIDLHISATNPTSVEGSAWSGSGILVDFDGDTRSSLTPEDIGADAGDFTSQDIIAPSISYTTLVNTTSTSDRNLTGVTITDASGVNVDDGSKPRLFYKKSTDANDFIDNSSGSDGWKYVEASNASSPFEFTIDYSLLQSAVVGNDIIQYFVVAQDMASPENVAINSGSFSNTPTKVNLDASSFPITGTINEYLIIPQYSGTYTVGTGDDFTNLTSALTAIDNGQIAGPVVLELTTNYSSSAETFPITFKTTDLPGISATNKITIRPASGASATISGSNATAIISLNAVNYITFDGRDGGTGSNKNLTITNTSTSAPAILFINDASNNTVKYTNVTGRNTGSTGLVHFSTATLGTTGNDNNTIDYCNISADGSNYPVNLVYSLGTSAKENNANTISNSNLFDFRGASSAAINISSYSTDFVISGNSVYQTSAYAGISGTSYGFYISNTSGNNFSITGNYIGGSAASCGSSAWTVSGTATTYRFVGIYTSVGTATPSSVQNNTIKNMVWLSSSAVTAVPGEWCGIYNASGNTNIGNITGNTIGSTTTTGNISLTISSSNGYAFGIANNASSSTLSISNNIISGIDIAGSSTSISHGFYGIYNYAGTTITINNNTVGSSSLANSINAITASTTSGESVYGIYNSASATISITNNTIANLNNNNSYTSSSSAGIIGIFSSSGTNTITGNSIYNFTTTNQSQSSTSSASLLGIYLSSSSYAGQTISSNTIHSLQNNYSSTRYNYAYGIYYYGPTTGTNVISKNKIHSISLASTSTTSAIYGIYHSYGTTSNISNNMVRLGIKADGTAMTTGYNIYGIYESTGTDNFYYNSVYVGGSGVTGTTSSTYAFYSGVTTNTRIFRNNVFANDRSGGTTGKHYAVRIGGTGTNPAGLTINNNIYYAGSGAVLGYYNSADVTSLTNWKTAIGQDAASRSTNPQFVSATGNASAGDLHINTGIATPVEGNAAVIAITDDIDGESRNGSTPDIGADEGAFTVMPTVDYDSKVQAPSAQIASGDVSSVANASGAAVSVFKFTINDLGSGDGFSTKVTSIKIKNANPASGATWTSVLAGALLNDGTSDIVTGTPVITSSDITFPITLGNLLINDGTTKDITLKVFLNSSNITDGQKLQFKVDQTNHGFDADMTGSQFASDFGSTITGNVMNIQVAATKLTLVSPSAMIINATGTFTVTAKDANNNVDLDNTSSVTLSLNTGNGTLSSSSSLTKSLSSGTITWNDVSHNTMEVIKVQAAASGLTTAISSDISVSNTIIIGTSSTTGQSLPINPGSAYSYSQTIYNQSDIGGGFTISQIAYQYNGNSAWGPDAIKIYMANNSKTNFSSTTDWVALGAMTLVYDGNISVTNSSGWVTIQLTTPFSYNGTDNLIIAVDENTSGAHSSSDHFYCSATSNYQGLVYTGATNTDPSSPAAGTRKQYIPNVKLIFNTGMTYVSSTTTQNTLPTVVGATDQQVVGFEVVALGNQSPIDVTSITVNANGTTSLSDISNAKLYYTGTTAVFSASNQFGSTYGSPTSTDFSITGTQTLAEGTNYFWLTYDVSSSATPTNVIDAEITSVTVGGIAQVPTITAPSGSRTIFGKVNGTLEIGTGGDYTTLTGSGGLFEAINNYGVSGNIIAEIISDITEDGATALNQWTESGVGNYTLTIRPNAAVLRTISGSYTGGLIRLNGADRVTIDGRYSGTGNYLAITNSSTGSSIAAIQLISLGTGAGATNNTIRNCNISTGVSTTAYGISVGGSVGAAGDDNDNISLINNAITVAPFGINAYGSATGLLNGLVITGNSVTVSSTTVAAIGIRLGQATGAQVDGNIIDIQSSVGGSPVGISLETGFVSSTLNANKITKVTTSSTAGYGARGITIGTGTTSSALTLSNNVIYGVNGSNYSAFGNSSSMGIGIGIVGTSSTLSTTTGGINLYFNSVFLSGNYSYSSACITAALYVGSGASALDIRNNIFSNELNNTSNSSSKAYGVYSAAGSSAFATINYNNYFGSLSQSVIGYFGSDRITIADWRTSTTQDANSISANPAFTSATDLHPTSAVVNNAGVAIGGITTDFAGSARGSVPDMGAYIITGSPVLTTGSSSLVKSIKATVSGSINPNNEDVYTMYFDYGTSVSYGTSIAWSPTTANGTSVVNYSVELSGLTANTTYHYRVRAVGATSGTEVGGDQTFTTYALPTDIIAGIGVADNGNNTITLSWTGGNGSGSLVKVNNQNLFTQPEDRTDYSASCNLTWQNAGEQFVYDGTSNSITINLGSSGTLDQSNIWVAVFEYSTYTEAKADIKVYNIGKVANEEYTTTLPVNLVEFTAKKAGDLVKLDWVTASEFNNSHYIVERSVDAKSYIEIARVEGNGTTSTYSSYNSFDEQPANGINYYRLAQYDNDGKVEYLGPISVWFNEESLAVENVYFGADNVCAIINSAVDAIVEIEIIDLSGKVISSRGYDLSQGLNSITIPFVNAPAGAYFVRVKSTNSLVVEKIVK